MARILFNCPSFDMPTRWATSFFNRQLLPWSFLDTYYRTRDLYRGASNRTLFSNAAIRSDFITGTGHGNISAYSGQNKQILWKIGDYSPAEVKGKIIKLLSCEVASLLGPDLISKGAEAFQGYNKNFSFFVDAKHVLVPFLDPVASGFISPVMEGIRALLKGKTNKEAFQIEYDAHTRRIEEETDPELKDWKIHNRDALIMLGNPDAKVEKTVIFPLLSKLRKLRKE